VVEKTTSEKHEIRANQELTLIVECGVGKKNTYFIIWLYFYDTVFIFSLNILKQILSPGTPLLEVTHVLVTVKNRTRVENK